MHWSRKWQPTPVFLAGESQGWGACWASVCGIAQSRTRLKQLSSSSSSIVNITPYFSWIYKREIARLWDKCMSDNASFPIWLCHYISTSTEFLFFFFFLILINALVLHILFWGSFVLSTCVCVAMPCGLWDLSSSTKDWTWAMAVKAWNPNH